MTEDNMKSVPAVACALLLLSSLPSAQTAAQSLTPFRSVEMRDGGHVIVRHDQTQRVIFLKGTPDYTRVTIASGDRLVIEKCKSKCPRGYELEIAILVPELTALSVANGGRIESLGSFPRQAEIGVTVSNGGAIDMRSIPVGRVTASVVSGGAIFAKPLTVMVASVVQGGSITYWGDARVTSWIEHGGVVAKGTASDADKPLSELNPRIAPVPPTSRQFSRDRMGRETSPRSRKVSS